MKLSLNRSDSRETPWFSSRVTGTLRRIAATLGSEDDIVELVLVDDEYIRKVNRRYRGIDDPTDVISFSYLDDTAAPVDEDNIAGEIYISYETLEKEAKEQGVEPEALFLRLGVHGLLHVLGHGHGTESSARSMEGEEKRLLAAHLTPAEMDELF